MPISTKTAHREGYKAPPGTPNPYQGTLGKWWQAGHDGAHVERTTSPVQPFVVRDGRAVATFIPWDIHPD